MELKQPKDFVPRAISIHFFYVEKIKYEIDMSGRAEIITSSRSILSRIFAPVYELFSTTE